MSSLPEEPIVMTEAEYLEFERNSTFKHEWIDGEVVAMTGASRAHNIITGNTYAALHSQLRQRPCEIYPADMRVKIEATRQYTYPDISIVCGDAQFADVGLDSLVNPTVIIEVLSHSTERYDRGMKFQSYRKLSSLQEYILISQDSPRIEHYRLQDDGTWGLIDAEGIDAIIELDAVGCTLSLTDVYEKVIFTNDDSEDTRQT